MMDGINGRLITEDNDQTNLSEQLILAIAERIMLPNETSAISGEENE